MKKTSPPSGLKSIQSSQKNKSKRVQPFNKFSVRDFEQWKELPRKKMVEEIIARHGVKNNRTKNTEREKIKWPVPFRVCARGTVGSKASYHFYLKIPGHRPYALNLPVDVPFSPDREWVDIPHWRKSKNYLTISKAFSEHSHEFMVNLLRMNSPSPIVGWFSNALLFAGFMSSEFVSQLVDDVGKDRFSAHCKKYFTHSESDARILLNGFTLKEFHSLTDEKRKMIEAGQMAKVFQVPEEFLPILQSNTKEKQSVLENQNAEENNAIKKDDG